MGFLCKVAHKIGCFRKFNRAREIEFNFLTTWTISMKLGTLTPGYKIFPPFLLFLPRDLLIAFQNWKTRGSHALFCKRISTLNKKNDLDASITNHYAKLHLCYQQRVHWNKSFRNVLQSPSFIYRNISLNVSMANSKGYLYNCTITIIILLQIQGIRNTKDKDKG